MSRRVRMVAIVAGITGLVAISAQVSSRHDGTPPVVHAQGGAYWFYFEQADDQSDYAVIVDHYGKDSSGEDFTAYKNANDSRIDAWTANPGTAPQIDGRPVTLTFEHPLNASDLASVIAAGQVSLTSVTLAGQTQDGRRPTMWQEGSMVPWSFVGPPIIDPACAAEPAACSPDVYNGVLQADGIIQAGGTTSLSALKGHADVYLADSTGIQVLDDVAQMYPAYYSADMTVSMPSAMWTTSGEVSFQ